MKLRAGALVFVQERHCHITDKAEKVWAYHNVRDDKPLNPSQLRPGEQVVVLEPEHPTSFGFARVLSRLGPVWVQRTFLE